MPKKSNIIEEVKKSILKFNMIQPGDKIIVAVSGGPDSICLLDLLTRFSKEFNISLVIAHYNHGLRIGEDDLETHLVKKIAKSLGLPFETEKASGLDMHSSSLEDKARNLRYDFFERIRIKYKAHKIALGHNLNDQAETVIMRLLRGSGMSGLSGIPPVRDNTIIRPLIEVKREDILGYLEQRDLEYATDSSNLDKRFLRNKIRLELLPEMIKYQPGFIEILGQLSENLRDEDSFLEMQADEWVGHRLVQDESGDSLINISSFKDIPNAFLKRVIRNIIKKFNKNLYGIESGHIHDVINLIENTRPNISIDLPKGLRAKKEYNKLIFTTKNTFPEFWSYLIKDEGRLYINEIGRTIIIEGSNNKPENKGHTDDMNSVQLDKDSLSFPLTLRNFKPGDRFIPLGMTGHKKVKDFFIDLKIPPVRRKQIPILLKDDKIIWVCGYRIDDRFKVTPDTKSILKITIKA